MRHIPAIGGVYDRNHVCYQPSSRLERSERWCPASDLSDMLRAGAWEQEKLTKERITSLNKTKSRRIASAENLCELYEKYNHREFVHPDPLEFLYNYPELRDREIVGLVASSLAYGAVRQILRSVAAVLTRMESPYDFLRVARRDSLADIFKDFKHRFTTGEELATMLWGVRLVLDKFGSLNACFVASLRPEHDSITPALSGFVSELSSPFEARPRSLLPSPDLGSACKRLNLFLRWMVRRDAVDPGGWDNVPRSKLVVPLDVHMHRISQQLGLTARRQANLRTAYEITSAFREIEPEDPVRYDFVLTRLGIRDDLDPAEFLQSCGMKDKLAYFS